MAPKAATSGSLAAAAAIPTLWTPALAQDGRGAAFTPPVATTAGRVRGLVRDRVSQFYGVPYAGSTAGANRFMPPVKTTPWSGVRDCFEVGQR